MPLNTRTSRRTELVLALSLLAAPLLAQPPQGQVVDRIIAVVGGDPILYSEIASRIEQARESGQRLSDEGICTQLEDMLFESLLLEQSKIDSVEADEGQVQAELDRRIRYFSAQMGGEEQMEKIYGKKIAEIKADFHDQVRDQLVVQQMQSIIVGSARVTPRDVQRFYESIPQDSVPFINAEVEFSRIIRIPKAGEDEVRRVRRKLEEIRTRIVSGGEDFCVLAELYSEDPGSKDNCGDLGMVSRGTMVPEFDAVAYSLREGEYSQVFTTDYGYHVMMMVQREGDRYHARHILIKPKVTSVDLNAQRLVLDSVADGVREHRVDFVKAAGDLSDDAETKSGGGVVIEPNSNSPRWAMSDLEQQDFFIIDKLKVGEVSDPVQITMPDGSKAYQVIRLTLRTDPHRANLKDDYAMIQSAAEGKVKNTAVEDWVKLKLQGTYVRILPDYASCPFEYAWIPVTK